MRFNRSCDFLDRRAGRTDIIEAAVIRLAHNGIQRDDLFISRLGDCIMIDGLDRASDSQRIGEHDGRFDLTQFLDLRGTANLPYPLNTASAAGSLS